MPTRSGLESPSRSRILFTALYIRNVDCLAVRPSSYDGDNKERVPPDEVAVKPVAKEQLPADEESGGEGGVLAHVMHFTAQPG